MKASIVAFAALVLLATSAEAATPVGAVARAFGESTGAVEGETRTLAAGAAIHLDEVIMTGPGARLALRLDDGTTITLGESARLTIDAFVYDPDRASSLSAAVAGAFRYVSGALSPASAREASVTTPVAVIAVRGTDFWGGPIDGGFGVALFEGAISVTSGGTTRVLELPGVGVDVAADAAPGEVRPWAEDKVTRALATVTFP